MTAWQVRLALAVIFVVGAGIRLVAARLGPILYPDACFQYLEPAWLHLTGLGVKTWEWNDGLRSWVLPAFHGGWLALGARLGIRGSTLGELIRAGWGLGSLLLVWAAWRGGNVIARQLRPRVPCEVCGQLRFRDAAPSSFVDGAPPGGWQGGLLAAALVAAFPLLAIYSVEPLTELPSMIAFVVGFVLCAELGERGAREGRGRALLAGGILSLAICLRVVNAALVLMPVLWLASQRRWRAIALMTGAALLPVLFFGLVDRLTWGSWFHSFVRHLKFNLIEGKAADFGTSPADWYVTTLVSRLPWGLALLAVPVLWGWRATWPYLVSAVGFVAVISTQAHKEERYAVVFWPLLLIAAGAVAGRWLFAASQARGWRRGLRIASRTLVVLGLVAVTIDGSRHLRAIDYDIAHARLDGQVWIAHRPHATGLLVDWRFGTGGYLWLDRGIPQVEYQTGLLANPLFSHVLVAKGTVQAREAREHGFQPGFERDGIVVLERQR